MKTALLGILVALLSGCAILNDPNIAGFGEVEVISHNTRSFPIDVYVNGQPVKNVEPGQSLRFVQPLHDNRDLLIEVYENGRLVTNKLVVTGQRAVGDNPQYYALTIR